ncbi:MAG: BrnT family toxin [Candidatus Omnitrophica bacterium]|nr:BrnT family toxin [Candidatus Omnitrophota bacterium]MBU0896316.1 BrnT family toxin [Candidatus Omnitrophota bacterium]MBU1366632.1 BrnT family toxin [Candidatus Omnitrophota bacterium]MBU1523253.1 BrnT family toxin [Candidatus Omnitrophota bacterium]MBU1810448.1 BrnT family toxin [Candidatus Omnitrophota bacterium]
MEFEYNPDKSKSNKEKHGIDFEKVKAIWLSNHVIVPAITRGEKRFMIIGMIGQDAYSCIFTLRKKRIRIISCRRARDKEGGIYHEKTR